MMKKTVSIGIVSLFMICGLVGILLIVPGEVEGPGPTYVSGIISTNTTWTLTNSPYIVIGNTLVEENVTLTIESGVEVRFDGYYYIKTDGKLIANGTEDKLIAFTSNKTFPASGDWRGLWFESPGNGSILNYCIIEFGGGTNGGGIHSTANNLEINYCLIENNTASEYGGGIYSSGYNLEINHSTIRNNSASLSGGGLCNNYGSVTINSSNITKNTALNSGGGFWNRGVASLNNCTINENSATDYGFSMGGGVFLNEGTVSINYCVFGGNIADHSGGGFNIQGGTAIIISHSRIQENSATLYGGGFWNGGLTNISIVYSTITENSAFSYGGGIYNYGSTIVTLKHSNIHQNTNYNIYNEGTNDMYAPYNWWGTLNRDLINQSIYDYYDDFNFGEVIFEPFLTEPFENGSGLQPGAPWPMFRGNVRHTGLSPYNTSGNDGQLKWVFDAIGLMSSSPSIGSDGTIYVGCGERLWAINPDGTEKWNFTTGQMVESSPAIGSDGTIYIGSNDYKLYAINPNGSEKWSYLTADYVESSPAISSEDIIYVGSRDGYLYAINPNGTERWKFPTGGGESSSPAIGLDGTIYIGSIGGGLWAINPNGTEKWKFKPMGFVDSSPAIDSDGTIYVGSADNKLYAINSNGTEKWSFSTANIVRSSPAIGPSGTIYVGSQDLKLYAINPNGTMKWSFATGFAIDSSPTIGSDGTIYIGSRDNKVYAINPNGTEKWSHLTNNDVVSSPAIDADGIIYIGSVENKLYAFWTPPPNQPPNTPSLPSGPTSGSINTSYSFSTSTTDPDGDQIKYGWDWDGDGTVDDWSVLVDSGTEDNRSQSWPTPGNYNIKVKAMDEYGEESEWSDALTVTISSPPSNQPPLILGPVPNQIKPEDSAPWALDLTPYEADVEDSGADLNWYLTDIDTSLYSVTGMNSSDDVLTFTPLNNAYGDDEVILWLEDSGGEKAFQVMWVNITPVNDIPIIDECPDISILYNTPLTVNYTPYIDDIDTPLSELILTTDDPAHASISGLSITYLYPESMVDQVVSVNITVSDGEGTDSDQITVSIVDEEIDTDEDGIPDSEDEDDDNDGYNDNVDSFPLNPTEWLDTDSDGIGDNADLDDDNDGYNDEEDYYPKDPTRWSLQTDISIAEITLSKYGPSAGEQVTIYVEIQNTGNNDCDAIVRFYDGNPYRGGTQISSNLTVEIPSHNACTVSVEWIATAGNHTLYVLVENLATSEEVIEYISVSVGESIPPVLVLSTGDINIYRFEPGQERTISVEVTCYLQTVNNVHLIVLDDQNLTIDHTITPLRTMIDGETIKFFLRIKAPQLPEGVEKLEKDILIQAVGDNGIFSNAEELDIVVSQSAVTFLNPITIAGAVATGSLATLGAAAAASRRNENWKYLLLLTFAVPLYTRIHGKKTLDNFVRGQVYGHIQSKPGTHFNEIRKTLKLGNGNLAYHLRKLEKEGFITSKRDKRNRRFYPVGVEVPEEDGIKLSKTQENILDYIERHPKSSQKDIARKIKESQQTISYNINVLVREGYLREEKINGTKRYEIFDENT